MKTPDALKSLLVGLPVILLLLAIIIAGGAAFGGAFFIFLAMFAVVAAIALPVGEVIRQKYRLWR